MMCFHGGERGEREQRKEGRTHGRKEGGREERNLGEIHLTEWTKWNEALIQTKPLISSAGGMHACGRSVSDSECGQRTNNAESLKECGGREEGRKEGR